MGAESSRPGEYEEPSLPEGVFEVRISVYYLDMTGISILNSVGAGITGAYHSGLVINGDEWSYGGHDQPGKSGVYKCDPEVNADYQFNQRIIVGRLQARFQQVQRAIMNTAGSPDWCGPQYDLIEHNCNHFASDLCWNLLRQRPPEWVNSTAESMARRRRRNRVEKEALKLAMASYRSRYAVAAASPSADAPGARAFSDTFTNTFEMAYQHYRDEGLFGKALEAAASEKVEYSQEIIDFDNLPRDAEDSVAERRHEEKQAFTVVVTAAKTAAHAVASAARQASAARAKQPQEGLQAWDAAWARESAPLLRDWKEAAVFGKLHVAFSEAPVPGTPEAAAHASREQQVQAALSTAAQEASEVAEGR